MTGHFRTVSPPDSPMINDADRQFIEALGPAIRRQLWLRFDTPGATTKGVAIQLDQLPAAAPPDAAASLANVMRVLVERGNYSSVSPVFERRGGPEPTARDREWMHAFRTAAQQVDLDIGIVLISHSRGVRAYIERSSG